MSALRSDWCVIQGDRCDSQLGSNMVVRKSQRFSEDILDRCYDRLTPLRLIGRVSLGTKTQIPSLPWMTGAPIGWSFIHRKLMCFWNGLPETFETNLRRLADNLLKKEAPITCDSIRSRVPTKISVDHWNCVKKSSGSKAIGLTKTPFVDSWKAVCFWSAEDKRIA
jgi:hypothetical protein